MAEQRSLLGRWTGAGEANNGVRAKVVIALTEIPQTCSLNFPTRGIGVGVSVGP